MAILKKCFARKSQAESVPAGGRWIRIIARPAGSFVSSRSTIDHSPPEPSPMPSREPPPTLALSVRQPWAELIISGRQTIETRSQPTKIRGRVYVYASLGRYPRAAEMEWAQQYGLDIDRLPRGVLVGTVEIFDCYGEEWRLRAPRRLRRPITPDRRPNPVWSRPF